MDAKYYMPQEKVGVLGFPIPPRSQHDIQQKAMYNSCNMPDLTFRRVDPFLPPKEGFVKLSDFGSRSARDLQMQMEYNPLVKEGYCSSNSGPEFAKATDDPYNPYSGKVQFKYN